jgi:hypothetical protein
MSVTLLNIFKRELPSNTGPHTFLLLPFLPNTHAHVDLMAICETLYDNYGPKYRMKL